MKKTLINLLIFLCIETPVLYLFQYFIETGLRKSKSEYFVDWNRIYQSKINADLIINGSSRAFRMVDPKIMDSVLHVNSYNLGMNGWTFGMQYARFKIYLQHNSKPKYVIQNIDLSIFEKRKDLRYHLQFLPYLSDSIILNNTNQYEGRFTFPELYFPMFKYNNKSDIIMDGVLSYFGKGQKSPKYKGYLPKETPFDEKNWADTKKSIPNGKLDTFEDETKHQILEYIKFCKQNDIKLIFEFAPFYQPLFLLNLNRNDVLDTIKKYARDNDIPFLDYSQDTLGNSKQYFYNAFHLNKKGSEIFTSMLANDVKAYLH